MNENEEKTKECTCCRIVKPISCFGKRGHKTCVASNCKECRNAKQKQKYAENPEKHGIISKQSKEKHRDTVLKNKKIYREKHADRISDYYKEWCRLNAEHKSETAHAYYLANKDKIKAQRLARYYGDKEAHNDYMRMYKNDRYEADTNYKLACRLRHRLYIALKDNAKAGSAVEDLGCTIQELREYLESKFQEGMTWDNWTTDGWHIDHIKPLASFDLSNAEEFKQAVHFSNLQPLWASENIHKSAKV